MTTEMLEKLEKIIAKLIDRDSYENIDAGDVKEWARIDSKVDVVCEQLQSLYCEIKGSHEFILDQCNYWQHKYCVICNEAQFPELIMKSCNELSKTMPGVSEAQYDTPAEH